jgi:hypothetical protein
MMSMILTSPFSSAIDLNQLLVAGAHRALGKLALNDASLPESPPHRSSRSSARA